MLFELFLKRGGKFKKENVLTINFSSKDKPIIKTNLNSYEFDKELNEYSELGELNDQNELNGSVQ